MTGSRWFARTAVRGGPTVLFCLPHAGGAPSAFRGWAERLAPEVETLAIALPGKERRLYEPLVIEPDTIAAVVAGALAERGTPPYAFYGHSMGGLLAFEVIRGLRRLGVALPARLYVGASRPPDTVLPDQLRNLKLTPDAEVAERLIEIGGTSREVLDHPELRELVLGIIRADFGWLEDYRYRPEPPLDVPIVGFAGSSDRIATAAAMAGWARHTSAGLTMRRLVAGHLFLGDERDALTSYIRADLTGPAPAGDHCVPLGATGWDLWREGVLRMAGFPADGLAAFASPQAAQAADACLDGGDRAGFEQVLAAQWQRCGERAAAIAADPLFGEAVTWQNPSALVAIDSLRAAVASPGGPLMTKKNRERVRLVAKYWQRYCGKNETIGFFGPSAWVRLDPDAAPVALSHGTALSTGTGRPAGHGLLRERKVWMEYWALAAVADRLAADPAIRRWLPVALAPHLTLAGEQVLRPAKPPSPLQPAEAAALRQCDGRQATAVVADLVPDVVRTTADGYLLLGRLAERGLVTWGARLPQSADAQAALGEQVAAIGDEAARERAAGVLGRLTEARDAVAASAGDPIALRAALHALDKEFTDLTGTSPDRRPGQMYAGRRLCYEDTVAAVDVVFGGALIDALAGPLSVLLPAARWLTAALAEAYSSALAELFAEVADRNGQARLDELWYLAQGPLFGPGERPADAVGAEFMRRWAELFGFGELPAGTARISVTSADLTGPAALAFPADRPGYAAARLHSPDVQICAASAAALAAGDFFLVLGEMHAAWPTFDSGVFTTAHSDPARLRDALATDVGGHRIRLLYPADWPRYTARIAETLSHPTDRQLAFTLASGADRERVLAITSATVERAGGELIARAPDGRTWPIVEVFAELISTHAVDAFKLVAAAAHTPRITVDKMVLVRETWRTTVARSGLTEANGEPARYLAARRLRRELGLPERVFVKIGTETKPVFCDLTSPVFVSSLCSMLRRAGETGGAEVPVTFSELLPGPEHAWLTDAAGRRYNSELRVQVRDPVPGRSA